MKNMARGVWTNRTFDAGGCSGNGWRRQQLQGRLQRSFFASGSRVERRVPQLHQLFCLRAGLGDLTKTQHAMYELAPCCGMIYLMKHAAFP